MLWNLKTKYRQPRSAKTESKYLNEDPTVKNYDQAVQRAEDIINATQKSRTQ